MDVHLWLLMYIIMVPGSPSCLDFQRALLSSALFNVLSWGPIQPCVLAE
jgi:hypothetical protein